MFFKGMRVLLIMMRTIGFLMKSMANAGSSQPTGCRVNAAFLHNFANFIEWTVLRFSTLALIQFIFLLSLGLAPLVSIAESAEKPEQDLFEMSLEDLMNIEVTSVRPFNKVGKII